MQDIRSTGGAADAAAALEAARRAAEAKRQAEEAAKRQQAAAQKAAALGKLALTDRLDDRLKPNAANASRLKTPMERLVGADKPAPDDRRFPTVTRADLEADPAVGKQLRKLAESPDPAVKQYVKDTAAALVTESLNRHLSEKTGQAALDAFTADVADLTEQTGLGVGMKAVAEGALQDAAKALLAEGVDAAEVKANPALGQVLAALKDDPDPAVQDQLKSTVKGWTDAALTERLEGQAGEDAVKAATEGYGDDLRALADATGLADHLTEAGEASLEDHSARIEELSNEGKKFWEKALDVAGDLLGKGLDLGGDAIKGVTGTAGDALDAISGGVAKGIAAGADLAGRGADRLIDTAGHGVEAATGVAARGLDALGADGAADTTRELGRDARGLADKAGDVAEQAAAWQGKLSGTVAKLPLALGADVLTGAGSAVNTGLDVTGAVAADGPMGAAETLANETLGPEKAEYAGQIDGVTGLIANRLGKGDSVFIGGKVDGEVGLGANAGVRAGAAGATTKSGLFAGAEARGAATLGRDKDGNLTLTGEFGGGVEAGVQSESEAGLGPAAEASAEAEAALRGDARARVTLKFDPTKPEDVARLKAILEPEASQLAAAAITANPLGALAVKAPAIAEAMPHHYASTEVMLKGGASADATAGVQAGELKAGATAEVDGALGALKRFNKDGSSVTTLFLQGRAGARVSAGSGPATLGAGAGVGAGRSIAITRDAQGAITGIVGEAAVAVGDTATGKGKQQFPQEKGSVLGSLSTSETETETRRTELTAAGLEAAKDRLAAGEGLLSVYRDLADQPGMTREATISTTTDAITASTGLEGALLAQGELNAEVTVGKTHTDLPEGDSALQTDLARDITQAAR